jgi:hypothetical protein
MYMFNMRTPRTDSLDTNSIACWNLHMFSVNRESTSQSTCSIVTNSNAYILYLCPFLFIFSLWYSFASRPSSP